MVLSALLGIFISFYTPSAVPLIQSIVAKEHLINANTTIDMLYELCAILGMGLSRFILSYAGIKGTFLIGGIFFIIADLFNFIMKMLKNQRSQSKNQKNWWGNYIVSLRYFKKNPTFFMPCISQIIIMTFLMTIPVIFVPYIQEILNAGRRTFTMFEALYSAGVFIGALLSLLFCKVLSVRKTLVFLLAVMAIDLIILSVNTHTHCFPVYFMIGFGLSSWVLSISLLQLSRNLEYQGRL
ncbi:MFS transporter [Candidatus Bartonella washoeensis]|uniref:Major facilitator superfamily (MFS) profile domain-containing protein n=1 Tax=Cardidatus Bartonella washoeensis 085-0475 TaxID=1094564 RepID=J1JMS8_9HYPH|nr:MFS transporter [Bartonella washoeensis]EJF86027.1 hypothetical protein MCW_00536 [Bartonella washoeensis 085-0475]